jgi:hypothetical protein
VSAAILDLAAARLRLRPEPDPSATRLSSSVDERYDRIAALTGHEPRSSGEIADEILTRLENEKERKTRDAAAREERQEAYEAAMVSWRGLPFGPSTKKVFCEAGITFPVAAELVAAHADDDELIQECAEHWKRHNSKSFASTGVGYTSVEKLRAYLAAEQAEEATTDSPPSEDDRAA